MAVPDETSSPSSTFFATYFLKAPKGCVVEQQYLLVALWSQKHRSPSSSATVLKWYLAVFCWRSRTVLFPTTQTLKVSNRILKREMDNELKSTNARRWDRVQWACMVEVISWTSCPGDECWRSNCSILTRGVVGTLLTGPKGSLLQLYYATLRRL